MFKENKVLYIPRVRVEPWRVRNWRAAVAIIREHEGRLAFAEWMRLALDDAAERVFELYGQPQARHLMDPAHLQRAKAESRQLAAALRPQSAQKS